MFMPVVSGVYAAAITPRREGPEIDLGSVFELIDFLCHGGVDGIVLMSATGEFPHFSIEERNRLVSLAVKRSRVPVLAGVSHSTLEGALTLAREAAAGGASAVLLMPPYFFPYAQEEIREFYLRFAAGFKDAAPTVLDNAPRFSSPIEPATAAELLETGQFAGIVDSGTEFERLVSSTLLPSARSQADGILSPAASAMPELIVALDRALSEHREERARKLEVHVREFGRRAAEFPLPVAIREAAALRGVKAGGPANPLGPERAEKLVQFSAWFQDWLPSVQKDISSDD